MQPHERSVKMSDISQQLDVIQLLNQFLIRSEASGRDVGLLGTLIYDIAAETGKRTWRE